MRVVEKINLNLNKLQGITTDAAPAMLVEKNGLTALIRGETDKASFTFGIVSLHQTSAISLFKGNKNESCNEHSCVHSELYPISLA
jgi:hypothetical protein